jgi:hypothetical protein
MRRQPIGGDTSFFTTRPAQAVTVDWEPVPAGDRADSAHRVQPANGHRGNRRFILADRSG